VPLARRDGWTREGIAAASHVVDAGAAMALWEEALAAPTWDGPPVWFHGDIAAGNLLVRDGRITAVIDWGCLGVGDPACDLIVAWELLDADAREVLRRVLDVDDATWTRSRGWALSTAVTAVAYYERTNPFMATQARHKLGVLLEA
jgi:aminoglycoside phosphotransferase (APT) family kinase protein